MKAVTLFVILDAFRWDYVNAKDTPFLYKLCEEGIHAKELVSTAGFTQRSGIFSGTHPDVTDNLTLFIHQPKTSPFAFTRPYALPLSLLDEIYRKGWPLSLEADFLLRRFFNKKVLSHANFSATGNVKLGWLNQFSVSEDLVPIYESKGLPVMSIFDRLLEANISYAYRMHPVSMGNDDEIMAELIADAPSGRRLYCSQFSMPDIDGHYFGPDSAERHQFTRQADFRIQQLDAVFKRHYEDVEWVIIGDHGMTQVTKTLDAETLILKTAQEIGAKSGRDFLYFLDSTMLRFWVKSDLGERVKNKLSQNEKLAQNGVVVDAALAQKYRFNQSKKTGDWVWWANAGVMLFPDYFHAKRNPVKGMHGYLPDVRSALGFAVVNGKRIEAKKIDRISLIDICPTICELVGIAPPDRNEGVSLMRQ